MGEWFDCAPTPLHGAPHFDDCNPGPVRLQETMSVEDVDVETILEIVDQHADARGWIAVSAIAAGLRYRGVDVADGELEALLSNLCRDDVICRDPDGRRWGLGGEGWDLHAKSSQSTRSKLRALP
jgi:hypothetical protein